MMRKRSLTKDVSHLHVADVPLPDHHDPLSTLTLAELYEQQGFIAKALDIYRTILADDPANAAAPGQDCQLEAARSRFAEYGTAVSKL